MKLTIYLDKTTTEYYQQLSIASGVPLRTLLRTTLQDKAIEDANESKGIMTDMLTRMLGLLNEVEVKKP